MNQVNLKILILILISIIVIDVYFKIIEFKFDLDKLIVAARETSKKNNYALTNDNISKK